MLTAYTLRHGAVLDELEAAARRGARVTVRLEGSPYADPSGELATANRRVLRELRRLGADARLADTNARNGPALHMKAAVCDGVAYLDDRNWPGAGDTIVRDDFGADVAAIRTAALSGRADRTPEFSTDKRDALWAERRLLAGARNAQRVDVESESFGPGSGVYGELKQLAASGVHCRLIVSRRDLNDTSRRALASLSRAGVAVRVSESDEKMAVVDGARAWIGSANATSPFPNGDQIDWGLRTDAPDVLRHLSRRFASTWNAATSFTVSS
ncbi:MAG TPA: phospholipase D-like domain-containing protein [Candidatus Rubrimentiphilum sp.]|nr:phospholipase D-like domain-containing protein [Candidatus Rubrimentiphilum sp.]